MASTNFPAHCTFKFPIQLLRIERGNNIRENFHDKDSYSQDEKPSYQHSDRYLWQTVSCAKGPVDNPAHSPKLTPLIKIMLKETDNIVELRVAHQREVRNIKQNDPL